jgi:hypothetical protein
MPGAASVRCRVPIIGVQDAVQEVEAHKPTVGHLTREVAWRLDDSGCQSAMSRGGHGERPCSSLTVGRAPSADRREWAYDR